jgi:hypothetical protein
VGGCQLSALDTFGGSPNDGSVSLQYLKAEAICQFLASSRRDQVVSSVAALAFWTKLGEWEGALASSAEAVYAN